MSSAEPEKFVVPQDPVLPASPCPSPADHKRAIRVGNPVILENLERVAGSRTSWLRTPVIPGFNDSEDHAERLGALSKKIGADRVFLLLYDEGGSRRSGQVGKECRFSQGGTPNDRGVERLGEIIAAEGVDVSVGS